MSVLSQAERWLLAEKYHGRVSALFKRDVERLKKGEPLAYVIGWLDFLGCRIDLSFRPLIPRPETEYWVSEAIKTLPRERLLKCLDLFAGSGCIGLAVLKHLPKAHVDFGDKDTHALKQIRLNLKINKLGRRARVIKTDVFSALKGEYDYIFANPPYVARSQIKRVQKNVLAFEPAAGLFAGPDGLFYLRRLLEQAPKFLKPGGIVFAEFDPRQKTAMVDFIKVAGYARAEFFKDQSGRYRWLKAVASATEYSPIRVRRNALTVAGVPSSRPISTAKERM